MESAYVPEPYIEGAYVFKHDGKYHLMQALWAFKLADGSFTYDASSEKRGGIRWSYDCVMAHAQELGGPYGPRYTAGTGIGHGNLFKDKQGVWYSTLFGNPRSPDAFVQPFLCRPAFVRMSYSNGCFQIDTPTPSADTPIR
jgi:hypothetical protein